MLFLVLGVGEKCSCHLEDAWFLWSSYYLASNTRACSSTDPLPIHSPIHLLNSSTHSPIYSPIPSSLFPPSLHPSISSLVIFPNLPHLTSIPHIYLLTSIHLLVRSSVPSSVHPYILSLVCQASTHTSVHPHIYPCFCPSFQSPTPPSDYHIFLYSYIPHHSFLSLTYHTFTRPALHLPMYTSIYPFIQAYF